MFEELLNRAAVFLDSIGVDYMVLGGFALPVYGAIRTTADLDLAVRVEGEAGFKSFISAAAKAGFEPSVVSAANPVAIFRERKSGLEVEFWIRPDGIVWDEETLRRRKRVRVGKADIWVVSPEDFIVSKLARPDRGVQDEKDVASVLARLGASIDRRYLSRRASRAKVSPILQAIESEQVSKS